MVSLHFALSSELSGAIAKKLPHAKNQPSVPGNFFNHFVTDIYIYIHMLYILTFKTRLIYSIYLFIYIFSRLRLIGPHLSEDIYIYIYIYICNAN